jgi:hypothetical protein
VICRNGKTDERKRQLIEWVCVCAMKRRDFFKQTLAAASLTTIGASVRSNLFAATELKKVLALAGTKAPFAGSYTRMFPNLPSQGAMNPHLEDGLIELAGTMRDDSNEPPKCDETPLAGYTYLGQFIDHDVTLDVTPLSAANPDAEQTQNFRTPFLDLDHVYGGGPTLSPFLYRNKQEDRGRERFLIGQTTPRKIGDKDFPASADDLPRNSEGIALVGDPRQDENLIIAQLHVAFLKLHNLVLEWLEQNKLQSAGPEGATCFEQARRLVTWHYQWVVRNDYLKAILDPDVFSEIRTPDYKPIMASRPKAFRIPVEFSVAAFRFGHSMVRNEYRIKTIDDTHKHASLKNLLGLTGARGGARPNLPADWTVCWKFFFLTSAGTTSQHSSGIDTLIAGGLYGLSEETKRLFTVSMPGGAAHCEPPMHEHGGNDLPAINLLRGARAGLPSGQMVSAALGLPALDCHKSIATGPYADVLKKYGFVEDTPLWYYVLKEAEVCAGGCHLGPTGSKLVGDVIMSALLRDPNSYISVKSDWKPTLPSREDKPDSFDASDLIRFLGPQPQC